jgi:signal transduction histidine kinase
MTWRLSNRPLLFDIGLVVALLILGLVELYLRPVSPDGAFPRGGDLWGAVATAAIVAPLLWRRRFPIWVLAASGVAYFAALLIGYEPTGAVNTAELMAVYGVGVYAARPTADLARWLSGALFAGGFLLAFAIGRYRLLEIALMFLTWVGVAIFGETVYIRRRYQQALEGRARQLEAEQAERARLARQEERARISREFHDIWAHTLSLVVVQAGAAEEVFDESPELARQALSTIQQAARRALAEVRRLIASDATETSPPIWTRFPASATWIVWLRSWAGPGYR